MDFYYCTFGDYMLIINRDKSVFDVVYKNKTFTRDAFFTHNDVKCKFVDAENFMGTAYNKLKVTCSFNEIITDVLFFVSDNGIKISSDASLFIKGKTDFGKECYAMSTEEHNFIRCAYGPVCTVMDNMIFDVQNDCGFVVNGNNGKKFLFNYESNLYEISMSLNKCTEMSVKEDVYKEKYKIDYAPINKNVTFKRPPVGWMTWYAVKFDASEDTVLENTRWLSENLKKYGAETIWVDWEWYHKDLTGIRDDGCDTFNPDRNKYPHGLKYLSDEIRKCGLIPSLWIGYTNDPGKNEYIKSNPEIVLVEKPAWCGQYFLDFSHPKYLNEFLPSALKQVDEWGYDAVKYDTLPISIEMHEKYHSLMYDPSLSTKQAYRTMVKKARDILGEDRYIMSCAGINDSDVLWACDMFDGARVGNDIFEWHDFIDEGLKKTVRFYPFHNVVFYNDADNVIIREEYNDFEQAKSRVSFVAMLGLPVTLGDNLPDLPEERVELLRRCIPVLDIRPMDICRIDFEDTVTTNLSISGKYEDYNIVSILNTTEFEKETEIGLDNIGIEINNPIVYEFYSSSIVNLEENRIKADLKPYETKVFSVRENTGRPQIISTSRHISQGALEIEKISWNKSDNVLSFTVNLVEDDSYNVTLYIPHGFRLMKHTGMKISHKKGNTVRLSVEQKKGGLADFEIEFKKI